MYINDMHILYYVAFGFLGIAVGQFLDWCNKRFIAEKKIFSKDIFKEYKLGVKANFPLIITMSLSYLALLYFFGFTFDITKDLMILKWMILLPMLVSALVIDYKLQIIPNRLNLTMFEVGLAFTFLYGIMVSQNVAIDMLLGMVVGGGIFLIITLVGGIIAGKEAMGFGDVKLMGAMGLFFGMSNMLAVAVISFLLGAVISVILLVSKRKKTDEYIPFGPFIVMAGFIVIFIPFDILVKVLFTIFTLGLFRN